MMGRLPREIGYSRLHVLKLYAKKFQLRFKKIAHLLNRKIGRGPRRLRLRTASQILCAVARGSIQAAGSVIYIYSKQVRFRTVLRLIVNAPFRLAQEERATF